MYRNVKLIIIALFVFASAHVFAANPAQPFLPSDNVQDPNCAPTDSNCYVTMVTGTTTVGIVNGGNTYGTTTTIGTNDNFNLNFETNNTNRVTIGADGSVIIATSTASTTLTVQGNGLVTGALSASSLTLNSALSIANGGTGATTTAGARAALGISYAADTNIGNNLSAVAWGDSLTAGAGGNGTTYPSVLASLSGMSVTGRGVGGQTSSQIAVRQGGVVVNVTVAGDQIPASGPVNVTFPTGFEPATSQGGTSNGTIAGVYGTVTYTASSSVFTRSTSGSVVNTGGPVPFLVDNGTLNSGGVIIWAGRNNLSNPTQVKSDIAAMVASLGHTRYIVMGILNGSAEIQGTGTYNTIVALNNDLAAIYGDHYIDIRTYLVNQYDPAQPQDVTDHNNDTTPSSLRSDALHLNAAGYTKVAERVYQSIGQLKDSTSLLTVANITELFRSGLMSPPIIGSSTANAGYFTQVGVGTKTFSSTTTKLQVFSAVTSPNFTGTTTMPLVVSTNGGNYSGIDFMNAGGGGINLPKARIAMIEDNTGSYLRFGTTGNWNTGIQNTALTINPGGNLMVTNRLAVGTSATSTPVAYLDLVGPASNTVSARNSLIFGNSSNKFIQMGLDADGDFAVDNVFGTSTNLLILKRTNGNLGFGVADPTATLDIASGKNYGIVLGGDDQASARTDATNKTGRFAFAPFLNAATPFTGLFGQSTVTDNLLNIGGGTSGLTAATSLRFFTASATTTTTGTERLRIDGNGNASLPGGMVIGDTISRIPFNQLTVTESTSRSGFTGTATGTTLLVNRLGTGNFTTLDFGNTGSTVAGVPESRIGSLRTSSGSYLYFGTSNNFNNGITNGTMVLDFGGNLGIGTTSPQEKLHVAGNILMSNGSYLFGYDNSGNKAGIARIQPGANDLYLGGTYVGNVYLGTGTGAQKMVLTNSGNVAIGSTTAGARLDVQGTFQNQLILGAINDAGGLNMRRGSDGLNAFYFGYGSSTDAAEIQMRQTGGGAYYTWLTNNGSVGERMRLNAQGNLMLGTTTADGLLSVAALSNTGYAATIRNDATNASSNGLFVNLGSGNASSYAFRVVTQVGAQDAFQIMGNGNVGIGTTSPSERLHVNGNILANGTITTNGSIFTPNASGLSSFTTTGSSAPLIRITAQNDVGLGGTGNNALIFTNSGGNRMYIGTTGLIGIGTTSPATKMHIAGTGAQTLRIESTDFNRVGTEFMRSGGTSYRVINDSDAFFKIQRSIDGFSTIAATAFTIWTSDNIGIGTTTPLDKLQVFGDIRVGTSSTNGCLKDYSGTGIVGVCSSDERLKTDILDLSDGYLDKMANLKTITYRWNDTAKDINRVDTTVTNYGLLAQNVEQYFPELVTTDANGYKQVNYSRIPLYLLKALQELNKKVMGMFDGTADIFTNTVKAKKQLCIDDVCIDKAQLQQMIQNQGTVNTYSAPTTPSAPAQNNTEEGTTTVENPPAEDPAPAAETPAPDPAPEAPATTPAE